MYSLTVVTTVQILQELHSDFKGNALTFTVEFLFSSETLPPTGRLLQPERLQEVIREFVDTFNLSDLSHMQMVVAFTPENIAAEFYFWMNLKVGFGHLLKQVCISSGDMRWYAFTDTPNSRHGGVVIE